MEGQVSIVGTGNVAYALAHAFKKAGIKIHGIYGRNEDKALQLSKQLGLASISLESLAFSNVVIIAVSDHAIVEVSQLIPAGPVVVHTSGSVAMSDLKTDKPGVFYPLQTFSHTRNVDFSAIPICIEGTEKEVRILAEKISDKVYNIPSLQRKKLHLAAVMVNNFSNHLYAKAAKYLTEEGLDFEMLLPLISETADKLGQMKPDEAQTGPAKREDQDVIREHLNILSEDPELAKLYRIFTDSIIAHGKKL